jgi:hypothetical protein
MFDHIEDRIPLDEFLDDFPSVGKIKKPWFVCYLKLN